MNRREALAALLCGPVAAVRAIGAQATDLTSLSISQALARLIRSEITPLQLADAYLSRIAALNKGLNAYVTVTRALARREARDLPNPRTTPAPALYGIPIAHKDLFETRGVRTTAGSRLFEHHVPAANAAIVDALHRAGAVMLGKTNTHELGGGVTTNNPFFGTTRNPVDRARIPGGSSGGSAAAVVARLAAAATGSDTGGSVRIPAALCGCVGFKPTVGRLSTRGLIAASPTFDHVGFLTRTVEDAGIMFRAAGGVPPGAGLPSTIRIGVARNFFFDDLEPAVASAVGAALARFRRRAAIADVVFPIGATTMARVFDPIIAFEIWGRFGADWRANPGSFSKSFAGFFSTERPSVTEYETALAALKAYQAEVDRLFDTVDVIATPTVPVTAPLIAGPINSMKILRNTWPFNAAGTPAISVPLRTSSLPVGLQLVARRGEDDKLLQIARTLGTLP